MTTKEKQRQSRDDKKIKWAKQVIEICDGWTLKRFDEFNWAIIRASDPDYPWYYGRLESALRDIPHKLLNEGDKTTLKDVFEQLDEIRKTIDRLDLFLLKTRDSKGEAFFI